MQKKNEDSQYTLGHSNAKDKSWLIMSIVIKELQELQDKSVQELWKHSINFKTLPLQNKVLKETKTKTSSMTLIRFTSSTN